MQNKGFVKVFAVALVVVCLYYLSFSFVTRHYESKAAKMEANDATDKEFTDIFIRTGRLQYIVMGLNHYYAIFSFLVLSFAVFFKLIR